MDASRHLTSSVRLQRSVQEDEHDHQDHCEPNKYPRDDLAGTRRRWPDDGTWWRDLRIEDMLRFGRLFWLDDLFAPGRFVRLERPLGFGCVHVAWFGRDVGVSHWRATGNR